MPTTVLFHSGCPDGIASAYACWGQFGDTATYIPVSYGQAPPAVPVEHNLYIVDFSYAEDTLKALLAARLGRRARGEYVVTVLDHHASAERDLAALQAQELPGLAIRFDLDESGASLTWKHLQGPQVGTASLLEQALPLFYKYVRDRDLWQWQLPDSKAISLAYRLVQRAFLATGDFTHIKLFAQELEEAEGYRRIVTDGTAMERYAQALVEEQAARARTVTIGGYVVPLVNTTTLFSEVGDYLCTTRPDIPFCAYVFIRSDGKYQYGLRGHNKVDLSSIAKAFGGGGHKNAAGFVRDGPLQGPEVLLLAQQ